MYLDLVVKDSKRPWVIPNVIAAAVLGVDDIMGSRRVASRGPPQADGAATAVFFSLRGPGRVDVMAAVISWVVDRDETKNFTETFNKTLTVRVEKN